MTRSRILALAVALAALGTLFFALTRPGGAPAQQEAGRRTPAVEPVDAPRAVDPVEASGEPRADSRDKVVVMAAAPEPAAAAPEEAPSSPGAVVRVVTADGQPAPGIPVVIETLTAFRVRCWLGVTSDPEGTVTIHPDEIEGKELQGKHQLRIASADLRSETIKLPDDLEELEGTYELVLAANHGSVRVTLAGTEAHDPLDPGRLKLEPADDSALFTAASAAAVQDESQGHVWTFPVVSLGGHLTLYVYTRYGPVSTKDLVGPKENGETVEVELTLSPPHGGWTLRALQEDGSPWPERSLIAVTALTDQKKRSLRQGYAEVEDDGFARLVPPDADAEPGPCVLELEVRNREGATRTGFAQISTEIPSASQIIDLGDVKILPTSNGVAGTVVDRAGAPVPEATINLKQTNRDDGRYASGIRFARSDEEGRFEFPKYPDAKHVFLVARPKDGVETKPLRLTGPVQDLRIEVDAAPTLRVTALIRTAPEIDAESEFTFAFLGKANLRLIGAPSARVNPVEGVPGEWTLELPHPRVDPEGDPRSMALFRGPFQPAFHTFTPAIDPGAAVDGVIDLGLIDLTEFFHRARARFVDSAGEPIRTGMVATGKRAHPITAGVFDALLMADEMNGDAVAAAPGRGILKIPARELRGTLTLPDGIQVLLRFPEPLPADFDREGLVFALALGKAPWATASAPGSGIALHRGFDVAGQLKSFGDLDAADEVRLSVPCPGHYNVESYRRGTDGELTRLFGDKAPPMGTHGFMVVDVPSETAGGGSTTVTAKPLF